MNDGSMMIDETVMNDEAVIDDKIVICDGSAMKDGTAKLHEKNGEFHAMHQWHHDKLKFPKKH